MLCRNTTEAINIAAYRLRLEPGDTIAVTFSGGPTELQMVESVEIPIRPDVQVTTLRNYAYVIEEAAA